MHILWLNANLLLPLDKGGKLRTWHLLRHLAARHDVTYLSFADPNTPAADRAGMRAVCHRLETVPRTDAGKQGLAFYADVLRHLGGPLPYAAAKYRSRAYARQLRRLLAESQFDLVVCDFLVPAVNLPARLPCASVVFTHNVEAEIWRRHADTERRPLRRWLLAVQWRRMRRFEGRTLRRFDVILAVSAADRAAIARLYPAVTAPVKVVPTGVDVAYFAPSPEDPIDPAQLVFTGSMDWIPNEDAMLFFAAEILPRIRARVPGVRLSIVGRAPTARIRSLASDAGIEVTGAVDDVRPWMRRAGVYVVPLRIGGGTRLKIFEALAMGKAVVSTTVGAEGLPLTDGTNVRLADGPEAFAAAVTGLIRDAAERRRLESAGRALMVARYDWAAVAGELEEALERASRERRAEAGPAAQDVAPLARPETTIRNRPAGGRSERHLSLREGSRERAGVATESTHEAARRAGLRASSGQTAVADTLSRTKPCPPAGQDAHPDQSTPNRDLLCNADRGPS